MAGENYPPPLFAEYGDEGWYKDQNGDVFKTSMGGFTSCAYSPPRSVIDLHYPSHKEAETIIYKYESYPLDDFAADVRAGRTVLIDCPDEWTKRKQKLLF